MAILTLKVEATDDKLISELAKAADIAAGLKEVEGRVDAVGKKVEAVGETAKTILDGKDALVLMERTRAIDQVKRLYTVMVGFATITLLTNVVANVRNLDPDAPPMEAYLILASLIVSFFSLLILFIFGAERLLDVRYLEVGKRAPKWVGLMWDVISLLGTAAWFGIVANLLPVTTSKVPTIGIDLLRQAQSDFIAFLMILYFADLILLLIQLARIGGSNSVASRAHWTWFVLNALSLGALYLTQKHLSNVPDPTLYKDASLVTAVLIGLHIVRFFSDVWMTFPFYYPGKEYSIATPAAGGA